MNHAALCHRTIGAMTLAAAAATPLHAANEPGEDGAQDEIVLTAVALSAPVPAGSGSHIRLGGSGPAAASRRARHTPATRHPGHRR